MQCDQSQCAESTQFLRQATTAAGWNLKTVDYTTSNPATLVSGLMQALQYHPTAVALVGLPYAVWSSVVPAYEKAGVAIIPEFVDGTPHNKVVVNDIAGTATSTLSAKMLAQWFIADSGAQGHALLFSIPELAPNVTFQHVFSQTVSEDCSKCVITNFSESFADVVAGDAPQAIVSSLQRNTSIKYVVSAEQALADSLPQAVSAAGISGVKFAGASAEKTEEATVQSGQLSAVTPTSLNLSAWYVVDAAIRHAEGMPQVTNVPLNQMLYTKGTSVQPSDSFNEPANWQAQIKKLWKVG